MQKLRSILILLLICATLFFGCVTQPSSPETNVSISQPADPDYQVGVSSAVSDGHLIRLTVSVTAPPGQLAENQYLNIEPVSPPPSPRLIPGMYLNSCVLSSAGRLSDSATLISTWTMVSAQPFDDILLTLVSVGGDRENARAETNAILETEISFAPTCESVTAQSLPLNGNTAVITGAELSSLSLAIHFTLPAGMSVYNLPLPLSFRQDGEEKFTDEDIAVPASGETTPFLFARTENRESYAKRTENAYSVLYVFEDELPFPSEYTALFDGAEIIFPEI